MLDRPRGAALPFAALTVASDLNRPPNSPRAKRAATLLLTPDPGRAGRPEPPGRGPAAVRAVAGLRQPPRAVRRADRAKRRGPGQLPAGLHAPGADRSRMAT